ncbi:MAG: hypothetical protein AAGC55_21360 [Myxococcota bacterium]
MLFIDTENGKGHVGLRPEVCYRLEIHLAIVDDGDRLFRFQRALFERLLAAISNDSSETELEQDAVELIRTHPTVFELFEEPQAARASLSDKEI